MTASMRNDTFDVAALVYGKVVWVQSIGPRVSRQRPLSGQFGVDVSRWFMFRAIPGYSLATTGLDPKEMAFLLSREGDVFYIPLDAKK